MIIPKLLKLIAGKLSLTSKPKRAFTLLELLIVIGIIGSLTAITVLILNPARYFSQSRDGRRLSEIQSINKALSIIKTTNANITYFGNPNWFYVSLPDPAISGNATSTCGGLLLPFLSSPWKYHCVSADNLQKTDGLGWIPVNFASSTAGGFANLPIDPVNSVTNNQLYAYSAEPYYELSAYLESEKYVSYSATDGGDDNVRYEIGTGGSPAIGTQQGFPAPTLSSVSPSTYWNDETTSVTISGSYFRTGATAKIGTTDLTSVTVNGVSSITASVPTGIAAGTYDVVVANTDTKTGTLSSGWVSTVPVNLSGTLSGLYSYADQKVVFNGNVTVTAYNGTDDLTSCDTSETGCLQINAGKIVVNSGVSINASASGYAATAGPFAGGTGATGGNGATCCVDEPASCSAGGTGGTGINGGYAVAGGNGDTSSDSSLRMGSGSGSGGTGGTGGASDGCDCVGTIAGGSGGSGAAGTRGGGYVSLVASSALSIDGSLITAGVSGSGGSGGGGGNGASANDPGAGYDPCGSCNDHRYAWNVSGGTCDDRWCCHYFYSGSGGGGGSGGSGAGGGVLLKSPTVTVNSGVTIDALGGGSSATNGGTVKIFTDSLTNSGTINRGRLCQGTYSGSCATQ